jgi:OmpA-OmpF porin, OOP family
MRSRHWVSVAVFVLAVGFLGSAGAQDCTDVEGGDHPRVPRYADACLIAHVVRAYDGLQLPTGPAVQRDGSWVAERSEYLEGRSTRIMYLIPPGRAALEVFRNYEQSLTERGFEPVFSCAGDACGGRGGDGMGQLIYPSQRRIGQAGQHAYSAFMLGVSDRRYLAARSGDGRMFVGLYLAESDHTFLRQDKRRVAVHLDVIELEEMEERMVDAAAMATSIGETGSVRLDNVYFEFAAATLVSESDAAITEMARLLRDNPELEIYIVGHTDSVGAFETNLDLSRRRAEAVVQALVSRHGIEPARLVPAGVGPLAPVASNATEAGRAENRRVELVAR